MPYSYISLSGAQTALASRLADLNNVFWTKAELVYLIQEALRTWNALTEFWTADFAFTATPSPVWYNLGTLPNSPRLRTVTDSYLYTIIQYHLLEPPTGGGAWQGTSQFSLADLQFAVQRRRDEIIQVSGCNLVNPAPLPSTPNTRRIIFPDSTLEARRMRFLPDSSYGSPVTLSREDSFGFDAFEPQYLQQRGTPNAWSVIAQPPLAADVDVAPNVPGAYDVISLQSGIPFAPPAATLLGMPDDWSWLNKWGALADLLGRDSEAADPLRAAYCLTRYTQGIQLMQQANWLLKATINGFPVDTPSVREMDGFAPEWENIPTAWPSLVLAGTDFCAPCPVAPLSGVTVTLVGNAPIPVNSDDQVQVTRDTLDAILDYAELLAYFKMGGAEFTQAADQLEKRFILAAQAANTRLAKTGIFTDMLRTAGERQEEAQPRFGES